jgi:hypothetical protein
MIRPARPVAFRAGQADPYGVNDTGTIPGDYAEGDRSWCQPNMP